MIFSPGTSVFVGVLVAVLNVVTSASRLKPYQRRPAKSRAKRTATIITLRCCITNYAISRCLYCQLAIIVYDVTFIVAAFLDGSYFNWQEKDHANSL